MKHSIIKGYSSWLNENLLIAEAEGTDVGSLYKAGDRAGLVDAAMAADSAEIKAHPAYASVMQWWKNGEGDLNLFKSLLKKSSSAKTDKVRSLKSIYYWTGGGTVKGAAPRANMFYKVADAIIANGAKAGVTPEKISQLTQAIDLLKKAKAGGFELKISSLFGSIIPGALTDGVFDTGGKKIDVIAELAKPQVMDTLKKALTAYRLNTNASKELMVDPLTSAKFLLAQQTNKATVNQYWVASMSLGDAEKKAMLDYFKSKADAYAARKKDPNVTFDKAILVATNLYIAPKNETITIAAPETPAAPTAPIVQAFSYPESANGDAKSPAFQKGLQLFPDDGVAIQPTAKSELAAAVKSAVDAVKAAGGTITSVSTWGYASTSQVGTTYKSADKTSKKENNVALANDRLASINTALAEALTANGVEIAPTVDAKNLAEPNRGPAWTDADKTNAKWGKPGARTPEYQATYGPWRYAVAFFQLTYTVTSTGSTPVEPSATPSGEWKSIITWSDESWKPSLPKISFGTALPKVPMYKGGSPTACPIF
jgi:hypothetical protein